MMRKGRPYIQCGSSRPGEWVTPDCAACDLPATAAIAVAQLLLQLCGVCCFWMACHFALDFSPTVLTIASGVLLVLVLCSENDDAELLFNPGEPKQCCVIS
jgi:hypothetical protein